MDNLTITRGPTKEPPRIIVYGGPGIGKSTFGANAPKPVFIRTEDGLGNLDVASFPLCHNAEDVDAQLYFLTTEDHEYQTLVFDSLDWYERMLWDKISRENGVDAVENIQWGKGFIAAITLWQKFMQRLDFLRKERNMAIILLAHSDVEKFVDPEKGEYNRYNIAIHRKSSPILIEGVDAVLFAKQDGVMTTDKKFGVETKRMVGQGVRTVLTQKRPSAEAKNRYNLPLEINIPEGDITWAAVWNQLASAVPYFTGLTKGEIIAPTKADKLPC